MEENRDCKKHGLTIWRLQGTKWYCKKCNVEGVQKRRDKLKILAIEYKGGKCCKCDYDKSLSALVFHNEEQDFSLSHRGHTKSWESIKKELDKCEMLCLNCHSEVHNK